MLQQSSVAVPTTEFVALDEDGGILEQDNRAFEEAQGQVSQHFAFAAVNFQQLVPAIGKDGRRANRLQRDSGCLKRLRQQRALRRAISAGGISRGIGVSYSACQGQVVRAASLSGATNFHKSRQVGCQSPSVRRQANRPRSSGARPEPDLYSCLESAMATRVSPGSAGVRRTTRCSTAYRSVRHIPSGTRHTVAEITRGPRFGSVSGFVGANQKGHFLAEPRTAASAKHQVPEPLGHDFDRRGRLAPGLKADLWHNALDAHRPHVAAGRRAGSQLAEGNRGFDRPGMVVGLRSDEPLRIPTVVLKASFAGPAPIVHRQTEAGSIVPIEIEQKIHAITLRQVSVPRSEFTAWRIVGTRSLSTTHGDKQELTVEGQLNLRGPIGVVLRGAGQLRRSGLLPKGVIQAAIETRPLVGGDALEHGFGWESPVVSQPLFASRHRCQAGGRVLRKSVS